MKSAISANCCAPAFGALANLRRRRREKISYVHISERCHTGGAMTRPAHPQTMKPPSCETSPPCDRIPRHVFHQVCANSIAKIGGAGLQPVPPGSGKIHADLVLHEGNRIVGVVPQRAHLRATAPARSQACPAASTWPSFSTMMWSARRSAARRCETARQVTSPLANRRSHNSAPSRHPARWRGRQSPAARRRAPACAPPPCAAPGRRRA